MLTVDNSGDVAMQSDPDTMPEIPEGWAHAGKLVLRERKLQGWSSRQRFADHAGVSERVVQAVENAKRTNFNPRSLEAIEAALGWPAGEITRAAAGISTVESSQVSRESLYSSPRFDRSPVAVPMQDIEAALAALQHLRDAARGPEPVTPATRNLGQVLSEICWRYIVRLVEDNCLPGEDLHPLVRPTYEYFLDLREEMSGSEDLVRYTRWLAGQLPDVDPSTAATYMAQWRASQRDRP